MSIGIVVRRTGGYAGNERVSRLDTSSLDAARRSRIEQLVRDAAVTIARSQETIGADLQKYEITVQENGTTRTLTWVDDGTFGPVRQLVEEVEGS